MSPPTAKRAVKPKATDTDVQPPPVEPEQYEAAVLAEELANYREFVGMAADGEQLDATDMAQVTFSMRTCGIPGHAWRRDIDGERRMREFNQALDELIAGQTERDIEVQQLTSEIQHIERRLAEAKGRRHELTKVVPSSISGYSQRIGQLRSEHPHLFHSIEGVVRARMEAKAKQAATFRADWGS
jgi:hypothetical protein